MPISSSPPALGPPRPQPLPSLLWPLDALASSRHLRALDLSGNPVGDEGAAAVARLAGGKRVKLAVLGLRGCGIRGSNAAVDALFAVLQGGPWLRRLDLTENDICEQGALFVCQKRRRVVCRPACLVGARRAGGSRRLGAACAACCMHEQPLPVRVCLQARRSRAAGTQRRGWRRWSRRAASRRPPAEQELQPALFFWAPALATAQPQQAQRELTTGADSEHACTTSICHACTSLPLSMLHQWVCTVFFGFTFLHVQASSAAVQLCTAAALPLCHCAQQVEHHPRCEPCIRVFQSSCISLLCSCASV